LEDKHRIEGLYLYLKKHEEMVILKG